MENNNAEVLENATSGEYKYGFTSDIDTDIVPPGLSEDVIRLISKRKGSLTGCLSSASRLTATG